jgi:hypothetical protein
MEVVSMAERLIEVEPERGTPSVVTGTPVSGAPKGEPSIGDLVKQATEQVSTLVRDEMALARAELSAKASHAGKGIGLFGGAGLVALYGLFGVLAAIVLVLAQWLPAWASALIVGGALLLTAGLLALVGRGQVRQASPPVPTETIKDLRTDLKTVTTAIEDGRR